MRKQSKYLNLKTWAKAITGLQAGLLLLLRKIKSSYLYRQMSEHLIQKRKLSYYALFRKISVSTCINKQCFVNCHQRIVVP